MLYRTGCWRSGLDRDPTGSHETPGRTSPGPDQQEQPTAGAPSVGAPLAAHHKDNAVGEAADNASGDASYPPVASQASDLTPSPDPSPDQLPGSLP